MEYSKKYNIFIRLLIIVLFVVLNSCSIDSVSPDSRQSIKHDNSLISYSGRMANHGSGLITGWSFYNKIPVRFSVQHADSLYLYFNSYLFNANTKAVVEVTLDSIKTVYNIPSLFYGEYKLSIVLNNHNKHNILFTMHLEENNFADCFSLQESLEFAKAEINSGSFLPNESMFDLPKIAFIGDSWGFVVPEKISSNKYNVFPISLAGGTALSYIDFYPYVYEQTPYIDPDFDGVIFNFGVNEYNRGFSDSLVYSSFSALISKIRMNQPTAKIFIINKPKNPLANKDFGKYRLVMKRLAQEISGTYFQDSDSMNINDSMWYISDSFHPNNTGYSRYAMSIEKFMDKHFNKQ